MKNYFSILGLSEAAEEIEIKSAYRKLAARYHPDRQSGSIFYLAEFRQIQEAYDCLSNQVQKEAHLLALRQTRNRTKKLCIPKFWNSINLKAWIINKLLRCGTKHVQVFYLSLDIQEAISGGLRSIQSKAGEIQVKIPAACFHGQVLTECYGKQSKPTVVVAYIRPNKELSIEARGAIITVPISSWEAEIGTHKRIQTFAGPTIINIPALSNSGDEIKLSGRGPKNAENQPIDLFIRLLITSDNANSNNEKAYSPNFAA